jgi:type VI secretion system secreted protein VgrG
MEDRRPAGYYQKRASNPFINRKPTPMKIHALLTPSTRNAAAKHHEHGAKPRLMNLVLLTGVLFTQLAMAAGPAPIDLKSCSTFAILAYSTITSTGGGIVNGNMGLAPGLAIVGFPPATVINGVIHIADPIAVQAQLDLTAAIIAASPGALPGGINVGNGELGGRVLAPGVYQSAPGSYNISIGDLTLNGGPNDVWVFQMASTLTVAVGRKVILTGGAQAKNVFWQVGSSATLLTSSDFKGTILAYASVTLDASSTLEGRALAQTGAVTFNGAGGSLPGQTLTIVSKHGTGTPPAGVYTNGYGAPLVNSITGVETIGGTQYVSTG